MPKYNSDLKPQHFNEWNGLELAHKYTPALTHQQILFNNMSSNSSVENDSLENCYGA